MVKTTVYLPEVLKKSLEALARAQNRSEADLIRTGIEKLVEANQPRPRIPLFSGNDPNLAENVDEALAGFGE